MTEALETRASLLIRIRDAKDDAAWREFVRLYAPLVYGFARRRGLQDADAADVVQDVLQQAATAIGRLDYDRERGTFRSWLFRVIRNRLNTWLRAQRAIDCGTGDSKVNSILEQEPAPAGDADGWDEEYERRLFDFAVSQITQEFATTTWAAFWQTAKEGRPPGDVARELKISVGAVYIAKSRVIARIRQKVQELEDQ